MNYDQKLDLILSRLDDIENKVVAPPAPIEVSIDLTLNAFVRPAAGEAPYGLGVQMTTADPVELIRRACHSVNWRGDVVFAEGAEYLDEVWAEIEALKTAKETDKIVQPYRRLFPAFVGVALLTNVLPLAKYRSFATDYDRWAGKTPGLWIEENLAALAGGGQVSGQ